MTSMIAIVGEAPSGVAGPALKATGYSGARLARLCGLEPLELERRTLRLNVFVEPLWDGFWPAEVARIRAVGLTVDGLEDASEIVLLGRRVAEAFGLRRARWFEPTLRDGRTWRVAPHPSGRSRWWNEPANADRAERFWRKLAERAA